MLVSIVELFFSDEKVASFLGVLARTSTFLLLIPILAQGFIPNLLKVFFSFLVSLLIFPVIAVPPTEESLVIHIAFNVAVGIILGILVRAAYDGIEFGAHMIATQMGLSYASVVNPMNSEQSNTLAITYQISALILFLSINGHFYLIMALFESFEKITPAVLSQTESMIPIIIATVKHLFEIGLKIAAPMMVAMLFLHIGLGILSKSVPTMNAFALSLNLNMLVAGVVLFVGNSEVLLSVNNWQEYMSETLINVYEVQE